MKIFIFEFFFVVKMTERRKNQSEEWIYFTLLFIYFITVNKYRFCISVIGYISVQIIGIGYKKINIGRSLYKTLGIVGVTVVRCVRIFPRTEVHAHRQPRQLRADTELSTFLSMDE